MEENSKRRKWGTQEIRKRNGRATQVLSQMG
jgi:hypothetical protein